MSEKIYRRVGERVVRKTLPNGLPVYVVVKPGFARKYAFFATRYGGMDLRFQLNGQWLDTPAGIAHYLEHKMFDTEEGNALQELAKNGAEPNAFTSNAITGYYFDSTEHFKENLRILLSFVSVPYFTDESVEKEQGISYAAYLGYSEAQFSDYQKLIDRIYPEKKLVVGYSLGWDVLCTVMQFLPFTLGMVLIVTLGDLFSGEERTGMVPILRSTKYGRASLLKCKLGAAVTITTVLWILFQLVMLMTIALTYTLRGATCTVLLFNGKPSIYGLNWLTYYLLQCAYSYLGTLVFTLFICCLSSILPLRLSMPSGSFRQATHKESIAFQPQPYSKVWFS